jgi:CubicO group peptidase (beta-lactamase class C family)
MRTIRSNLGVATAAGASLLAPISLLFGAERRPEADGAVAEDSRVARALEFARTWLEAERAYERILGVSAAVVYDQQILWMGGFGKADVAANRPGTSDTVYSICSISKHFSNVFPRIRD